MTKRQRPPLVGQTSKRPAAKLTISALLGVGGADSDDDLAKLARRGLPADVIGEFARRTDVPAQELIAVAGINRRTLDRRVAGGEPLRPDESDRVMRIARVTAFAVSVFGPNAFTWLHEQNVALGDAEPFSMLDTDMGARMVEQVIGRALHGVFS
jgi:putative toxin-antitoxin system antitoxin component (TIGR02293 family)